MTTTVYIRTESNSAFATVAQVCRHVEGDGLRIDSITPLPAGEEVELSIHDTQYLRIVESEAESMEEVEASTEGDGTGVDSEEIKAV